MNFQSDTGAVRNVLGGLDTGVLVGGTNPEQAADSEAADPGRRCDLRVRERHARSVQAAVEETRACRDELAALGLAESLARSQIRVSGPSLACKHSRDDECDTQ